jgi:hypothetical protein
MRCTNCDCRELLRLRRDGFLENRILPIFGFYPWHCPQCKAKQLLRYRGKKRRKLTPQTNPER